MPLRIPALAMLGAPVLAAGVSGLACTAILQPNDDVQRCGSFSDCDAAEDPRFETICFLQEPGADGVCVERFRENLGCNPETYKNALGGKHPLYATHEDALDSRSRYVSGCSEDSTQMGCNPTAGKSCAVGLTPNEYGVCDDDDENTPAARESDSAVKALVDGTPSRAPDVLDQFCRSIFCDTEFVCSEDFICGPCDPNLEFGEGGCGELYLKGARSSVYQTQAEVEAACASADPQKPSPKASPDDARFGDLMPPPG